MKLQKAFSLMVIIVEIIVIFGINAALFIAEIWISGPEDNYVYPQKEVMSPITVMLGESFVLPLPETGIYETAVTYSSNPNILCVSEKMEVTAKACHNASILVYIKEKQIPQKEMRYKNCYLFNYNITPFLNDVYAYVRQFLNIEYQEQQRTIPRTLKIYEYPVICSEISENIIENVNIKGCYVNEPLTLDLRNNGVLPSQIFFDQSIIAVSTYDASEEGYYLITPLVAGQMQVTVDYYQTIPVASTNPTIN